MRGIKFQIEKSANPKLLGFALVDIEGNIVIR